MSVADDLPAKYRTPSLDSLPEGVQALVVELVKETFGLDEAQEADPGAIKRREGYQYYDEWSYWGMDANTILPSELFRQEYTSATTEFSKTAAALIEQDRRILTLRVGGWNYRFYLDNGCPLYWACQRLIHEFNQFTGYPSNEWYWGEFIYCGKTMDARMFYERAMRDYRG